MLLFLYETLNVVISGGISGYVQTAVKSDLFIKSDLNERVFALSFVSDQASPNLSAWIAVVPMQALVTMYACSQN